MLGNWRIASLFLKGYAASLAGLEGKEKKELLSVLDKDPSLKSCSTSTT